VEAFWSLRFQQLQKSWYIFLFQLTEGPEKVLSQNNYEILKEMMRKSTRKNVFSEEELEKYVEAWSQPGALTASINYYRANWNLVKIMTMTKEQQEKLRKRTPKVQCPTLVIWGEQDIALDKSLTKGMEKHIEKLFELKFLEECGHWAHLEEPDIVNEYILSFVK
jgi:pimeloyl-ACP methyl ester carboxylesterase